MFMYMAGTSPAVFQLSKNQLLFFSNMYVGSEEWGVRRGEGGGEGGGGEEDKY